MIRYFLFLILIESTERNQAMYYLCSGMADFGGNGCRDVVNGMKLG